MGTNPDVGADEVVLEVACATTGPGTWTETDAALWTCGIVPGTTTDVTVGHAVTTTGTATAGDLEVDAALTLGAGSVLEVWDRLTPTAGLDASAGTLALRADADGPAVLDAGFAGSYVHEWRLERQAGWRQLGSPVGDVFSSLNDDVHTQGAPWATFTFGPATLFSWDAATQAYVEAGESADGPFGDGTGYFFYVYEDTPDGGPILPIEIDLEGAEGGPFSASWADDGTGTFAMIANPFGGVLSWDAVFANAGTDNVSGNVWAYDPDPAFGPGYRTYNAVSGVDNGMTGALAPFQGVWVQGAGTVGTATVDVEADDRDNALAPAVYDRRAVPPTLAVHLEGQGLRAPAAIAVFDDRAAPGPDALDAEWLRPISDEWAGVYFVDGDRPLVFDARPAPRGPFDLEVEATVPGRYTLSWPDLSALEDGIPATLVDRETGARVDLRASGSYAFEVVETSGAVDLSSPSRPARRGPARFALLFGEGATSSDDVSPGAFSLSAPFPNPASSRTRFAFSVPEPGPVALEVVDLLGRRVAAVIGDVLEAGPHAVDLEVGSLSAGVYVVRMRAGAFSAVRRLSVVR